MLLYQSHHSAVVNYRNLTLEIISETISWQGEFIIFEGNYKLLEFEREGINEGSQEYKCLSTANIDSAIVICRKHIHELTILSSPQKFLCFKPTK